MTCSETRDLLSAWLDEALDDHEREQVEAHLAGCPESAASSKGFVRRCRFSPRSSMPGLRWDSWTRS